VRDPRGIEGLPQRDMETPADANVIVVMRRRKPNYRFRWYNAAHKQKERRFVVDDYGGKKDKARQACAAFRQLTTREVVEDRRQNGESEEKIAISLRSDGLIGGVTFVKGSSSYEVRGSDGCSKFWCRSFAIKAGSKNDKARQHARALAFADYVASKPHGTPISVTEWELKYEKQDE